MILCIFLGVFGVHRFYLKDTKLAAVQLALGLLSCFIISSIWATVDFVMLLAGSFKTGDGRLITQN
ncbi:MAG: TM2 domain-containing protein [Kiritimatiellae bacterium]|nr:TM2 domain-containing protein [Kiritimatiellia bacterium]